MKDRVNIQNAETGDARDIQQIFYESWLDTYPNDELGITEDDIKEKYRQKISKDGIQKRIEMISNLPKNQLLLVAKYDDKVVGVCKSEIGTKINQLSAIYIFYLAITEEVLAKCFGKRS